jgi:hypothetical protein
MTTMTSIASESAFSTSGRMLGDYQSSMKPKTFEALVCCQDWIRHDEGLDAKEDDSEEVLVIE